MKKIPHISETEWVVMKVVWEQTPSAASQIIAALNRRDTDWHPRTVKSFLNRLVKKKALGFKLDGRAYLYHPLVRQSECAEAASVSFLDRVFEGSLQQMVAHFVARKRICWEEIRGLQKLLDGYE